jgi:hypothetical protein
MEFKQLGTGTPPDIEARMSQPQTEAFLKDLESCEGGESVSFDNATQGLDRAANGAGGSIYYPR